MKCDFYDIMQSVAPHILLTLAFNSYRGQFFKTTLFKLTLAIYAYLLHNDFLTSFVCINSLIVLLCAASSSEVCKAALLSGLV